MKRLTVENYQELQPYIELADYNEYNSNTITMLMWSSMYPIYFKTFKDYAIVNIQLPQQKTIWLMPYCKEQYREDAISQMQVYAKAYQIPLEIHSMNAEFKNWLFTTYPQAVLVWNCYNAQDYIYDRKQQETLIGKKMQKRRNHLHAFINQYGDQYQYKSIEISDIPNIYDLLSLWRYQKTNDVTIAAEEIGIHLLLEHFDTLPIQGGCIYIDGKLQAFTIASMLSDDTIQIHVEKANRNIRGLYIAILKFFLETLKDNVCYINREDDMGHMDLRKAKRDMQPIYKTVKFACIFEPIKIRKASAQDITKIANLWTQRFQDETSVSTAYYFSHLYEQAECYLLLHEDELISMLQLRKMKLRIDDTIQQVSFIVGVATNKAYEGCGYMKILLQHVLDILSKKEPCTLLQAYDGNIYKPFGFEAFYKLGITKLNKLYYIHPYGELFECKHAKTLLDLYQTYTSNKNGYRIRSIEYYEHYLFPYKKLWKQKIFVHKLHNKPVGYMIISYVEDSIQVVECVYTDYEQLEAMLSLLCKEPLNIYIYCDIDTILNGRRKEITCMMVKIHNHYSFPDHHLFINEEL